MKKSDFVNDDYVGKFRLDKYNDKTRECSLIQIDDNKSIIEISDVKSSVSDLDYADVWMRDNIMLIELVMNDGSIFENWANNIPPRKSGLFIDIERAVARKREGKEYTDISRDKKETK